MNEFMPHVFAASHDSILKRFYITGQETTVGNVMHTWALDHDGLCFSANIFTKILPLPSDFEIIGLVHKLNS